MGSNGQEVGYTRVSSYDQNLGRQLESIKLDRVFKEKASAKDAKRPELKRCLDHIREGDTLHVHSIDRLARNLRDLREIVEEVTVEKKAALMFHKENLQFTGKADSMNNLMLNMLGAVAEFERALIKERQAEGIAAAQKKGVRFGAKRRLTDEQVQEIRERAENGEQKLKLAEEYGVSRQTIYTALKRG